MARALLSTIAFAVLVIPTDEPIEALVHGTVDVLLNGYEATVASADAG